MNKEPEKKQEIIRDKKGRFIKGHSGNPTNKGVGRPKGSGLSITTEIKKKLEEYPPGQKTTYLKLLINRILKQAIQDGDQQMIKNIWNYIDGMPKQSVDMKHEGKLTLEEFLSDDTSEAGVNKK